MTFLLFVLGLLFPQDDDIFTISEDLARSVINQKVDEEAILNLQNIDLEDIKKSLNSDEKKKAFWINVYNGLIYYHLRKDPSLYKNKDDFFGDEFLNIAGELLSFDDIEHNILRKSTWKYSFGYLNNPFASDFLKENEVDSLDPRIHFALNCGAKSCPPVKVYYYQSIDEQLHKSSKDFLEKNSYLINEDQAISVTPLLNWFRGDFGGKTGIIDTLLKYGIINSKHTNLRFQEYDWTLSIK